jgi:hypothetical protein
VSDDRRESDRTSIVVERHFQRLTALATRPPRAAPPPSASLRPAKLPAANPQMAPTILTGVADDMAVMREIFGRCCRRAVRHAR